MVWLVCPLWPSGISPVNDGNPYRLTFFPLPSPAGSTRARGMTDWCARVTVEWVGVTVGLFVGFYEGD